MAPWHPSARGRGRRREREGPGAKLRGVLAFPVTGGGERDVRPMSDEIVAAAESHLGIRAGIARLEDVLSAPSYHAVPEGEYSSSVSNDVGETEWPADARSVLVLGLHHPEENPRLDWWARGRSPGDRRLVRVAEALRRRFRVSRRIGAMTLPYAEATGGVFLKDAAVLAGLGVVGRNNLVVTPEWGPRIRFRALLLDGDLEPTGPLEGFALCESCDQLCHQACPRDAFAAGSFHRPSCVEQINADVASRVTVGAEAGEREPSGVIQYCRACEFACPAGR